MLVTIIFLMILVIFSQTLKRYLKERLKRSRCYYQSEDNIRKINA